MSVAPALGIGENVQLDLPDATVQLLGQRRVPIIEFLVILRLLCLPNLGGTGSNSRMVTVVSADNLDLVQPDATLGRCLPIGSGRMGSD
jgi:hypothetical protein